jgi:hypothetical protein
MNTRTLGLIAIAGSPFLGIDFIVNNINEGYQRTALGGVFSLLYMTGWVCSILALYRLKAAGNGPWGKGILITQLVMLGLGELWNVYAIADPLSNTVLFRTLDLFWPLSNCFMLITGIAVIRAKQLQGWKRFVPFVVGLWFPLSLLLGPMVFGNDTLMLYFSSLYSALAWLLLGVTVYVSAGKTKTPAFEEHLPALKATA